LSRFYALLGLALLLAGCASQNANPGKLKVGTVDVMRVMEGRPETVDIRLEWANQAGETYLEISEVSDQAEAMALQREIAKRSEAWQKRMDLFVRESIDMIELEATTIAKEKGLDIVLVDNPLTKTIRYREGEDLTLDVSLELQNK
jgi:uncharacterized protein YigE (DUF2233 family)